MIPFVGRSIDRCILLYIKECFTIFNRQILDELEIEDLLVIPGNQNAPRGQETYISVLPMSDDACAYPFFRQLRDGSNLQTVPRDATYSIQFYRQGAFWLAKQFDAWCMSEDGLTYAAKAFSDGRIERIRVLDGGNDIPEDSMLSIDGDGMGAIGRPSIVRGAVAGVQMLNFGHSYSLQPSITLGNALFVADGAGFVIEFPLKIRRLDAIVSDMFEERVQIDLRLRYNLTEVQETGYIETTRGNLCLDGEEEVTIDADS